MEFSLTEHGTAHEHRHTTRLKKRNGSKNVQLTTHSDRYACNICIHHIMSIQYKSNPMTIYIIFTINILHFCFMILESTVSAVLRVEVDGYFTSHRPFYPNQQQHVTRLSRCNPDVFWKKSLIFQCVRNLRISWRQSIENQTWRRHDVRACLL